MQAILNKELILDKTSCRVLTLAAFVILISLGAFVRIPLPFTPVPLTLQTFFVFLSAAFLGSGLGAATQLSYIVLGSLGLPIFTGAGFGALYLLGPTGGYLFGFIMASLFVGRFIRYNNNSLLATFLIFCAADALILSCGTLWLKFILGASFAKVMFVGFIPFIPGDLFKAALAAYIYLKLSPRVREIL